MPQYDNAAIATVLDTFGDLLEVAGADRYRYLSYHKAAHALRAWDEDISAMAASGRLTEIPGVGAKLAGAIAAFLATGTFPEYEAAIADLPASITQLLRIPGLGPKRAKTLFEELAIASVDDLEEAIAGGRLDGLAGFGPKTVESIAAGIARFHALSSRTLLADALPLGEKLVEEIAKLDGVRTAACAGSLRRLKETVGDIDVLVAADTAEVVMESVRALPLVTAVIASGDTKTSVMTTAGLQVDVRVIAPESWGAALQYFTGSAEHNVRVREIAKARGLKVNEYGVYRLADGVRVAGGTEEDVYAALGMVTPPPEVRENAGEIELALDGRVPPLVTLADIRGDLHAHTDATDGRSTLDQNRAKAAQLGYEYIACSDHAYALRMVGGLDRSQLEEQWACIDELNARGDGPYVLKAIELNIDDEGGVDYPDSLLARFDLCVASLHTGWNQSREQATRRLVRAMENPYVDIIGHPTGRLLGRRDPFELDMEAVLAEAGETGTIMEVNASPDRLDLSDVHMRMARRHGVRVAISTDAHEATQLNFMGWGVMAARRGWMSASDVLNAQPLDVMRTWLKRSRA